MNTKALNALKREYPLARLIAFEDGLYNVYVGDEYYEEVYSYSLKDGKLVYVGVLVNDAA